MNTKKEETRTLPAAPPVPEPAMYRGVLGDIVDAARSTTEADPVGVLASLLAAVSVAIGPHPHVQIGNTRHPLLVWPLLLGRTGSGRKGEASDTGEVFWREADPDLQDLTVSGLSSGEGLIERIKDSDKPETSKDEERRKKRLLVIEPEFASVMARAKREGSTLAAVLRQAWDGRALSVLNRAELRASSSHIAIIGHITPREFRLKLADADMAGGTYNRFLAFFVERSGRIALPEGVSHQVKSELAVRLAAGLKTATEIGPVGLDPEATQLWVDELYDEFTECDDDDNQWTEFARRAAPYCRRIAALYAVTDGRDQVNREDLTAAGAVVRYGVASARHVLDGQSRNPQLDRIQRAIDAAGEHGLTKTEVTGLFSRNLAGSKLDALLGELLGDDTYEESERRTGGRPAKTYRRVLSSSFVPIVVPDGTAS